MGVHVGVMGPHYQRGGMPSSISTGAHRARWVGAVTPGPARLTIVIMLACRHPPVHPAAMTRATIDRVCINRVCAALPGAAVSDPWGGGHDAWKVGGKMFACVGSLREGVSVKTDSVETAEMLIAAGVAERAPYFHRSWVYLPEGTPGEELHHRIVTSYTLIRAGLPKKVQAALGPVETG